MMILAVFRSRTQCMDFVSSLKRYGVIVQTAPTPKEAKIGCGLCAKILASQLTKAKAVLSMKRYSSFKGLYRADYSSGRLAFLPY